MAFGNLKLPFYMGCVGNECSRFASLVREKLSHRLMEKSVCKHTQFLKIDIK